MLFPTVWMQCFLLWISILTNDRKFSIEQNSHRPSHYHWSFFSPRDRDNYSILALVTFACARDTFLNAFSVTILMLIDFVFFTLYSHARPASGPVKLLILYGPISGSLNPTMAILDLDSSFYTGYDMNRCTHTHTHTDHIRARPVILLV